MIFSGSPTYQTDRAVLFFTSSIRAKDALNQHPLPALLHLGKVLLIWHNHQRSLPKSSKSETRFYQTELASTAVKTLKEVMEDTDAPASARIAAARTSLELAGDIGKHSHPNETMSRTWLKWHLRNCLLFLTDGKMKNQHLQRILHLFDKGLCTLTSILSYI